MLNNNILERIYELQGKLAEIVNELDELEKLVNSEDNSEEVAEVVEPREVIFDKDSPFYDCESEEEELLQENDELIALLEEAIGEMTVQKTVINNSPITINIGGNFNLPIIGRESYANPLPIRRTTRVKLPNEVVQSRHTPQKQIFKSFVRSCLKKGGK